jgi:hypothetical protein
LIDKISLSTTAIFAKSYIAGDKLSYVIYVSRKLNSKGVMTTIDILDGFVFTKKETKNSETNSM